MALPITRIVKHLNGVLEGDSSLMLEGLSEFDLANTDQICFAESSKYLNAAKSSRAGALIVPLDFPVLQGKAMIRVENPRQAFIQALELFAPDLSFQGIHASACVAPSVRLGKFVGVGPHVVIEDGAVIGDRVLIRAGAYIGANARIGANSDIGVNVSILHDCKIGSNCLLHPGVCIGADGYGFRWQVDHHHKIPQLGKVVVEDNVEIGANACIDRATLGETKIGEGTKLDNLVHIAHNNLVGRHVIMAAQVGIAGSSKISDGVVLAGQVGVVDHVAVGPGVQVMAQSLVTKNIEGDTTFFGSPARPIAKTMKQIATLNKIPGLLAHQRQRDKEFEDLQDRIEQLEKRLESLGH